MKSLCVAGLATAMLLMGLIPAQSAAPNTNIVSPKQSIPYVPTRHDTVKDLLWLAEAGTNDVVYDLGSGDGRIAIAAVRDFGVRKAVGIELNPQLVRESREKTAQAGVADRVEFIQGDLFTNDFSQATVLVLYLGHGANLDLRAAIVRTLKPGARIVSHQFGLGEWAADKTLDVRTALLGMYSEMHNPFANNPGVPDFTIPFLRRNHDRLSTWIVPAPVAGIWRGKLCVDSQEAELTVSLQQRLSGLSGSFQLLGATNTSGTLQADLWGSHLRLYCMPTNQPYGQFMMWFDGQAKDNALKGTLWISQAQGTRDMEWMARREKTDCTGTWEWTGPTNSPVQLKIERRQGRLTATYLEKKAPAPQPIQVSDFYDFGGGIYFTFLLGREGSGRRLGPGNGWLIGEGIMLDDNLSGTIAFYPYPDTSLPFSITPQPQQPNGKVSPQEGWRAWLPKPVAE